MSNPWWKTFYQKEFEEIMRQTPFLSHQEIAKKIHLALSLSTASTIFDQCCGLGQLSQAFAELGHTLYGVDQSASYIQSARKLDLNQSSHFDVGDAFSYVPPQLCDLVVNWHTSFGYTPEDLTNQKMLERGFESLHPKGHMLLEYYHSQYVQTHFQAEITKNYKNCGGSFELKRFAKIEDGLLHQTWQTTNEWGDIKHSESHTKMYTPQELKQLFKNTGFSNIKIWSDLDQTELSESSPRCILVGQKP